MPRRASLYARSPPIFTAEAAGIGSSISPRRRSSCAAELVLAGGAWLSTTSPSGSPVEVRRRKVDLGEVALVQPDEAWRQLSCPDRTTAASSPVANGIERPRVTGPRAGHAADLRHDGEGGRAARLVDERDARGLKRARWHVARGSPRGSARRSPRAGGRWRSRRPGGALRRRSAARSPRRRARRCSSEATPCTRAAPSFSCSRISTASSAPSTARR